MTRIRGRWFFYFGMVAASLLLLSSVASALQGGPDKYGYRYIDSNELKGPKYELLSLDIKGESYTDLTKQLSNTTISTAYPIGFDFEFYGKKYNYFYISGNGYITFTYKGDYTSYVYEGQKVPSKDNPNTIIAPFWSQNDIRA